MQVHLRDAPLNTMANCDVAGIFWIWPTHTFERRTYFLCESFLLRRVGLLREDLLGFVMCARCESNFVWICLVIGLEKKLAHYYSECRTWSSEMLLSSFCLVVGRSVRWPGLRVSILRNGRCVCAWEKWSVFLRRHTRARLSRICNNLSTAMLLPFLALSRRSALRISHSFGSREHKNTPGVWFVEGFADKVWSLSAFLRGEFKSDEISCGNSQPASLSDGNSYLLAQLVRCSKIKISQKCREWWENIKFISFGVSLRSGAMAVLLNFVAMIWI